MRFQRRPRFVVAMALALGVSVLATAPVTAAGAGVYGVGGGSIDFGTGVKIIKFAFSGHSGPQGDFGSLRFDVEPPFTPFEALVDIDCVQVFPFPPGAGGWIGGAVTKVTPQPNALGIVPGTQLVFGINDFGEPSGPIADELTGFLGSPQVCKLLGPTPLTPISQGNINIKLG